MEVTNVAQFEAVVTAKLMQAMDMTMEILLSELKRIIDNIVYGWESPATEPWKPNRTGQFLDSWQKVKSEVIGGMVVGEINQAIEVMQQFFIGNTEVHGDRDNLAEIIEYGEGYNFGEAEGMERPYWETFRIYVIQNLSKIFASQCLFVGLEMQIATVL